MPRSDFLRRWPWSALIMLLWFVSLRAPAIADNKPISCVGDCNGDGVVTIDELITGVDLALQGGDTCPALDCNSSDLGVFIDCIVLAVNNAMSACPPPPIQTEGRCCLGECPGSDCFSASESFCGFLAQHSENLSAFSWCPSD